MTFPWRAWVRFYFKLSLISAWNGVLRFVYVASGAGAAQCTGLTDIRTIGMKGALYVFAGTVVASVAAALFRYQLPDPAAPTMPTEPAVALPVAPTVTPTATTPTQTGT